VSTPGNPAFGSSAPNAFGADPGNHGDASREGEHDVRGARYGRVWRRPGEKPGPGPEADSRHAARPEPPYDPRSEPGATAMPAYPPGTGSGYGPAEPDPFGYDPGPPGYGAFPGQDPSRYAIRAGQEPPGAGQGRPGLPDDAETGTFGAGPGFAGMRPGAPAPPAVPGGPGYEFGFGPGHAAPVTPPRHGPAPDAGGAGRIGSGAPDVSGPVQAAGPARGMAGGPGYEFGYGPGGGGQDDGDAGGAPAGYEFGYGPGGGGQDDDDAGGAPAGYYGGRYGHGAAGYVYTPTVIQRPPPGLGTGRGLPPTGQRGGPGFEFSGTIRADQRSQRPTPAFFAGQTGRQDDQRSDRGPAEAEWASLREPARSSDAAGDTPGERRALPPPPLSAAGVKRWAMRVALPTISMIAVGVAAVATFGGSSGASGPAPGTLSVGFPAAMSASSDFSTTPAEAPRGIDQSLSRVASSGPLVVAVGSQAGARIGRAQFFLSDDGGRNWRLAPEQAQDGGAPPPGHAAALIAGGQGAWAAIGPDAIWTSRDGMSWTLASARGIAPVQRGDQVNVLRRTATGFLAAGENVPPGDPAASSPVVWTSSNGVTWRRLGAAQLHLAAGGTVAGITFAAVSGKSAVISGTVTRTVRGNVTDRVPGAWRSTDGGATWTAVTIPVSNDAENAIVGLATTATGFVAIRPGLSGRAGPDAVAYVSADGADWKFAATLTRRGGLSVGVVNGGPAGAVVTGQSGGATVAFTSVNGASWRPAGTLIRAAGQMISGVTVVPGGAVVAAGTAAAGQVGRQAVLTVDNAGRVSPVNVAAVSGAAEPEVAVNDIAASGTSQVAVGSANGFPAAWLSADAGTTWTRAIGTPASALDRPGLQELSGVAHGTAGWVAVGGVQSAAPQHPVVVTSPAGRRWQAADTKAAFAGRGVFTVAAAAGQAGYVIVGWQVTQAAGRTVPAAWWSAGLTGWQRAASLGGGGTSQQMLAAAPRGDGFVAVGANGNRPAAWVSGNGRTWRLASLALPPGAAQARLRQVTVNGRRIVAVGMSATSAGQEVPFAAESANGGTTWTESLLPSPGGAASVDAVAATGTGFTATGTFGTGGRQDVVIWTSVDGIIWKTDSPPVTGLGGQGIQQITALAVSGSTLTGVGFTASPTSESPTIWRSPIRS
jgi:hypothetical protein